MASPTTWTKVRSTLANAHKDGADPDTIVGLERDLRAARAVDYLRDLVDKAPPLTADQIVSLRAILDSAHDDVLDATGLADAGEQ